MPCRSIGRDSHKRRSSRSGRTVSRNRQFLFHSQQAVSSGGFCLSVKSRPCPESNHPMTRKCPHSANRAQRKEHQSVRATAMSLNMCSNNTGCRMAPRNHIPPFDTVAARLRDSKTNKNHRHWASDCCHPTGNLQTGDWWMKIGRFERIKTVARRCFSHCWTWKNSRGCQCPIHFETRDNCQRPAIAFDSSPAMPANWLTHLETDTPVCLTDES